ncbi:leucyl/phenylalanyl-tRNA--protein transferase [Pararhodobacter sp.]|uniref:leucyl/phenylalanyl-tRNA--protein transferase n=1 Tax=Pararhodobacter sp. TaxID=2127056 RepID=UPI002AFDE94C|nr:leucyl/phenylalanyl-tRNA--protein transferase [Pararhodobacter sp.]
MRLTPDLIVKAYAGGVFPMAETAQSDQIHWFEPRHRGVMPLDGFHVARSLVRTRRRGGYRFSCDQAFSTVIAACADREDTWINAEIAAVFKALHVLGLAHSVEVWSPDGAFAGGVYGLALGGAFFAESMVSRVTDGSKMALAELVARLKAGGFRLMDTQYVTPHLASLGGVEISRAAYRQQLAAALAVVPDTTRAFGPAPQDDGAVWR